jgi:hypothetical protein
VVDEPDERRADGDGRGLRHGQRHLENRVGAALQVRRGAALQQRDGADDDPREAGAEQDRARQDHSDRRCREQRKADGGERHPEHAAAAFARPRHDGRRRRPRGHGAGPLHRQQHAEEGGRAVQAVVHDGEEDRLAEPERGHGERTRHHEPA